MKKIFLFLLILFVKPCLAQDLVIKGATVYPSPKEKPILDAVVIVRNGKIVSVGKQAATAIPKNASIIEAKGLFLAAGYWNSHVHFSEPKWNGADTIATTRLINQLNDMLNSRGFTHVFDLAELDFDNLNALRARVNKGEVPGPFISAVGLPLAPLNGSPFYIRPAKLPEVGDTATAIAAVISQVKSGAQGIKLFTASSNGKEVVPMKVDVAKAVVRAAHRNGIPVFAHPSTDAGVNIAIAADVDILAHVAPDAHHDWSPAIVELLVKKHMALVPTLKMFQWSLITNGADTTANPLIKTALQQLKSFHKAGGTVLFGTDVGYMTDYSTVGEFDLMARAGLRFPDILKSLTTAPAEKFGLRNSSGRIAKGYDADIVLLSADPASDSRNFSAVVYTIAKGKIIYHRQ